MPLPDHLSLLERVKKFLSFDTKSKLHSHPYRLIQVSHMKYKVTFNLNIFLNYQVQKIFKLKVALYFDAVSLNTGVVCHNSVSTSSHNIIHKVKDIQHST